MTGFEFHFFQETFDNNKISINTSVRQAVVPTVLFLKLG